MVYTFPAGLYIYYVPHLGVWLVFFDYFRYYSIVFLLVTIKITSFIQKQSKSTKISTKLENHRIMSKNHQKTKHSHTGPFWRLFGDFLMIFWSTSQNLSKFSLKTSPFLNFPPNCSDWSIRLSNVLTLSTSTPDTDNISSYRPNHPIFVSRWGNLYILYI